MSGRDSGGSSAIDDGDVVRAPSALTVGPVANVMKSIKFHESGSDSEIHKQLEVSWYSFSCQCFHFGLLSCF